LKGFRKAYFGSRHSTVSTASGYRETGGIKGGAEPVFWRLAWIIFNPNITCTSFRNSGEGREESVRVHIPAMLRAI